MFRQIKLGVQSGPITNNGILSVTTLFFKKFCFSLTTSYKELIWCTKYQNVDIHIFCKRWSFIWGCFFPVSILKYQIQVTFLGFSNGAGREQKLLCSNKMSVCILKICKNSLRNGFNKIRGKWKSKPLSGKFTKIFKHLFLN